ncbi:hypothetical protein TorRG33x02_246180 [Trema orientale]|uniref:Uncharacterized protein n=1 Tax=Trema orientale TaxID=63057 RepID=A0A2P5DNI8_TREOI|nr:hypothetical protein TorRG33x02_246180 [Trema orientale]
MRELAAIAAPAASAAVIGAHRAGVVVPTGVSPASLLAGMGERAVGPVMAPAPGAAPDLELVHTEVVGRVRVGFTIVVGFSVGVVVGKELLKKGTVVGAAGGKSGRPGGEHVGGGEILVVVVVAAGEELPWWNVEVSEEEVVVVVVELVLLVRTDATTAHDIICIWEYC